MIAGDRVVVGMDETRVDKNMNQRRCDHSVWLQVNHKKGRLSAPRQQVESAQSDLIHFGIQFALGIPSGHGIQ